MICILKHMTVLLIKDKNTYTYACDSSGMELNEPIPGEDGVVRILEGSPDTREYWCTNCLQKWEGETENAFDKPRAHLGKDWSH